MFLIILQVEVQIRIYAIIGFLCNPVSQFIFTYIYNEVAIFYNFLLLRYNIVQKQKIFLTNIIVIFVDFFAYEVKIN